MPNGRERAPPGSAGPEGLATSGSLDTSLALLWVEQHHLQKVESAGLPTFQPGSVS